MIGFGVIKSEHVERAFRRVDRKFFVPAVSHVVRSRSARASISCECQKHLLTLPTLIVPNILT